MNSILDASLKVVPIYLDVEGYLAAYDAVSDFQIEVKRIFVVSSHKDAQRGRHAHKELTQILICVSGICKVTIDDGVERKEILLDRPNLALKIPNQIWAEQNSEMDNTVLVVACDLPFDENDYIRNYDDFLKYRTL